MTSEPDFDATVSDLCRDFSGISDMTEVERKPLPAGDVGVLLGVSVYGNDKMSKLTLFRCES